MKTPKVKQQDDGRVLAKMNVEGMPWYSPAPAGTPQDAKTQDPPGLRETLSIIFGSLGAALLVAAAFGGAGFLVLLFCRYVWLA